jgi:hypothetical protein
LLERRIQGRQHRGLFPRASFENVSNGNRSKTRLRRHTCARGQFADRIPLIHDGLGALVLSELEVSIRQEVQVVVPRRDCRRIGRSTWIGAGCVSPIRRIGSEI